MVVDPGRSSTGHGGNGVNERLQTTGDLIGGSHGPEAGPHAAPPARTPGDERAISHAGPRDGPGHAAGERGRTVLSDRAVSKIAAAAARDVPGVHGLNGEPAVAVGKRQAAADLDVAVEYGVVIPVLAAAVRVAVIVAVESMTGLEVVEVNIVVGDVRLPGEERRTAGARVV